MKKFMLQSIFNFIKNHYILLTLYCYGIGLIYHVTFYWHFGVPIIYYFELLDIILYVFYILIFAIIPIVIGYLFCRFILASLLSLYPKKIKKKDKSKFIFYLGLIISTAITPFVVYVSTEINWYGIASLLIWLYMIYNFINYLKFNPKHSVTFYTIWTCVLIFLVMLTAKFKYYQVVDYDRWRPIYFTYTEDYVGGDLYLRGYRYIGETSTFIFVYRPKNGITEVLSKTEMKVILYKFNGLNF